jgi:hypothetical protein
MGFAALNPSYRRAGAVARIGERKPAGNQPTRARLDQQCWPKARFA